MTVPFVHTRLDLYCSKPDLFNYIHVSDKQDHKFVRVFIVLNKSTAGTTETQTRLDLRCSMVHKSNYKAKRFVLFFMILVKPSTGSGIEV